jgi:hypothetical protein
MPRSIFSIYFDAFYKQSVFLLLYAAVLQIGSFISAGGSSYARATSSNAQI